MSINLCKECTELRVTPDSVLVCTAYSYNQSSVDFNILVANKLVNVDRRTKWGNKSARSWHRKGVK